MLESVKAQIDKVKQAYAVEVSEKDNELVQMIVKDFPTQGIRNKSDVMTVLPQGYPQTMPNGFSIRNENGTWNNVCFRPQTWDPAKDTLWKWIKMIECYFKENPQ